MTWRSVPWTRVRDVSGVVILLVVVLRVGLGPFLEGLRAVDLRVVAVAVVVTAVTTVCSAWRWRVVARGLGVDLPLGRAVAAYYRSQLLNSTLPGGVLGDVHRGLAHGHDVDDVARALRAVAWERAAGQAVQLALTVLLLLVLPSPVRGAVPWVAVGLLAVASVAVVVLRRAPAGPSRLHRAARAVVSDVRGGLLAPGAWPVVLATSVVVVAGHATVLVVSARAVGTDAPLTTLVPLALLLLAAMTLPLSFGGWGPREGVAAWAFAAAGLGASVGVATATVYGVVALVATLPGAAVLVLDRRAGRAQDARATMADLTAEGGASRG